MTNTIQLGARGSALARGQTDQIIRLLRAAWPALHLAAVAVNIRGDRLLRKPWPSMGGRDAATHELEEALRRGLIDLALHSLEDLPIEDAPGLVTGAILARANPADVLVSRRGFRLGTLPPSARIGASSHRRSAQLKHLRPDLAILDPRSDVETQLNRALAPSGPYDAIVLAYADLERLGRLDAVSEVLPFHVMLPGSGQAALAVQCRHQPEWIDLLAPLNHAETRLAVTAERAFWGGLGGGPVTPIATLAEMTGPCLRLRGRITTFDGSRQIDVARATPLIGKDKWLAARRLGLDLAQAAVEQGPHEILMETVYAA